MSMHHLKVKKLIGLIIFKKINSKHQEHTRIKIFGI